MKQRLCRVVENRILWGPVQLLSFDAPELALAMRPGQFSLARDPTTLDPYLRRTLWLYRVEGDYVAFTLSAGDPFVARARVGHAIDLLAPLGRAVELDTRARHVLLIGEGTRVAPLMAIAHAAVQRGCEVTVVALPGLDSEILPAHLLAPEIEYRTEADSLGADLIAWADAIVASGSERVYRDLADRVRAARHRLEPGLARALLDLPMPCGTGACYACAVETTRGVQLSCVEGAWFDLADLRVGGRDE